MGISKKKRIVIAAVVLAVAGGLVYWLTRTRPPSNVLTLYGNVDIRQVQSAFNDSGRIQDIRIEEGATVKKGDLLAELDPARFMDTVARDQGQLASQQQVLRRLLAGSRPEEIAEARAQAAAAQAVLANAQATWRRQRELVAEKFVSQQSLDDAAAALKTARANLDHARQALILAIKGPRKEDIAAARGQLQADQASLAFARRELADTRLYAPADAVVQDRILEPGDMTTPATPVFTLALDNPVWVRAYLPERALGRVRTGLKAWIISDSFPGQRFPGWIGFISPTAEFTPKSVETPELRTELVYRVRVYACNPGHRLRLGMPVTVDIPLGGQSQTRLSAHPCG
ncbi:MAG: efflux RND transporter periplasmic adaptor subunit [Betaproteobacteria bacterium]|nr:efflux RND transporter periplasmic adaptor subunit [Betaproteobacteria bacterium]